jgi:beta-N-acetylhexosaminidase
MEVFDAATLSLEQKVGQLFFIGIPGPTIDVGTAALLDRIGPGGVCLFARNIKEVRQTRDLLDGIADRLPVKPILSLDQEGGLVDRLRRIITATPAPSRIRDERTAADFAAVIAEIVRRLGFNMDFAPVVDVIDLERSHRTNGLYSRTFGSSAEEVTKLAAAFLESLQAGGCLGCVKHFPGLGASEVDSHEELPRVSISENELMSVDLAPYESLLSRGLIHSVMVAHATYPEVGLQEVDQNGKLLPSSLSGSIVDGLLRRDLRFDGLVITDDLEMGAIVRNYGVSEACKLAIEAGVDMLAICAGVRAIEEGYADLLESVRDGRIAEARVDQSVQRIFKFKTLLHKPLSFDQRRLEELSEMIADLNKNLN